MTQVHAKNSDAQRVENLRLQYVQIMENYRHVVRGGISAMLIFLAVTGLSVQVALSKEHGATVKLLVFIFSFVLAFLEVAVATWIIRYFRHQQKTITSISTELGLSVDDTLQRTVKIVLICVSGLVVLLVCWAVYFVIGM